jgi:hypothetical protein
VHNCSGQTKRISIPNDNWRDSSSQFSLLQKDFRSLGLVDLLKSKEALHIRISSEFQVVDIWTDEQDRFIGTLVNFTMRVNSYQTSDSLAKRILSNKIILDSAMAKQVYNSFMDLSINAIPTDSQIRGWNAGDDGLEYTIEYSTPTTYSFKEYWSPFHFTDKIKEARIIQTFVDQTEKYLHLRKSFEAFINSLPDGCYRAGGISVMCSTQN